MGNDASKKKSPSPENSSKDILSDKFSEFENISHPSSPENTLETKTNMISTDEMSYSGILVDKSGSIMFPDENKASMSASAFSSPTKGGGNDANPHPNRRRIIKATHPAQSTATTSSAAKKEEDEEESTHHGKHHLPAVLSPKASSELLQESIVLSKSKRLEQLSREQKSKRDKLLEAKRRGIKTGSDSGSSDDESGEKKKKKETPQPNPFSKFLRVFSVEPQYPHHKRSYEEGEIDREEAAVEKKATSTAATSGRHSPSVVIAAHNDSKRQKLDDSTHDQEGFSEKCKAMLSFVVESLPEWVPMATASAAMAAVAVMVALKISAMSSGGSKGY